MESNSIFKKNFITLSHIPTVFIIIGYIIYWVELYFIKVGRGRASPLALILFIIYLAIVVFNRRYNVNLLKNHIMEILRRGKVEVCFFMLSLFFIFSITACISYALLLPPHLAQEFDSLNYHITLPKQHLILNSFKHIKWSAADLWLLPLDFSLAPYWLVTALPNKLSQIIFVFGLIAVVVNIVNKLGRNNIYSSYIAIAAIFGSHSFGIQMGILMFDLVLCYLFIAALDSFLDRKIILSAVEFTFFLWSKSFIPFQLVVIFLAILLSRYIFFKLGIIKNSWGFEDNQDIIFDKKEIKRFLVYVLIISLFVAGPFILKSIYYVGTPLYPFFPGIISNPSIDKTSLHWKSIIHASEMAFSTKNAYGSGRTPLDFLQHLWILAVPERGVVNRYDYPLGLPYLLFLVPFLYFIVKSFKGKKISILPFFAIIYWLTWWFSSQQARFLYIPLALMFITVSSELKKITKTFMFCLLISLAINSISILRAHYGDFGRSLQGILREKDKKLLALNEEYYKKLPKDTTVLDYYDVAYADFPVKIIPVEDNDFYWVLEY